MFKLEERGSYVGPFYVAGHQIGEAVDSWEPGEGHHVTLKSEGVTIVAELTLCNPPSYEAKILFFEDYDEEELSGKKAGDTIEFDERNAFGFSK